MFCSLTCRDWWLLTASIARGTDESETHSQKTLHEISTKKSVQCGGWRRHFFRRRRPLKMILVYCMPESKFGLNPMLVSTDPALVRGTEHVLVLTMHHTNSTANLSVTSHRLQRTCCLSQMRFFLNKTMTMAASQMAFTVQSLYLRRSDYQGWGRVSPEHVIMFWMRRIWKLCCKYECKYVLGQASQK